MSSEYRGRFAPSPTGPLHFGSLVAAVASFADAKRRNGKWLVRIEDVDETRCRRSHEDDILAALQTFGMQWDEPPVRQSERAPQYQDALDILAAKSRLYRCSCSRRDVASAGFMGNEGPVYSRTCQRHPPTDNAATALRVVVDDRPTVFDDRIHGRIVQNLDREIGDFVVRRLDGCFAYQLAVTVDDHEQGITNVVRGADLLWSTPRQVWLQQLLGYPSPRYAHVPLIYGKDGKKLSKRDKADPVTNAKPVPALMAAWRHLGQAEPSNMFVDPSSFWQWALPRWNLENVPKHAPTDGNDQNNTL